MPSTIKSEGGGKRWPLNMRTTREIREQLEAAAAASGRSLSQEVEYRISRSFEQPTIDAGVAASEIARLMGSMVEVQQRLNDLLASGTLHEKARDVISYALVVLSACQAAAAGSMVALHPVTVTSHFVADATFSAEIGERK
jgi:Arc-like DNA binding domain